MVLIYETETDYGIHYFTNPGNDISDVLRLLDSTLHWHAGILRAVRYGRDRNSFCPD